MYLRLLQNARVDGELDGLGCRPCPEVVHTRLQPLPPTIEVHARQLAECGRLKVDVQALALANEGTTISGEINDFLLANLPHRLVDGLDVIGNVRNVLDGAIVCNDHVLHVIVPETKVNQFTEEPRANDLEFTGEHTTSINVATKTVSDNIIGKERQHTLCRVQSIH